MEAYWTFIVGLLILGIFYFVAIAPILRRRYILKNGIEAVGLVDKILNSGMKRDKGFGIGFGGASASVMVRDMIVWDIYMEIDQPGKPRRRINMYHCFGYGVQPPAPGDTVAVLIHPTKPDKIILQP